LAAFCYTWVMQVILSDFIGYCGGVARAINLANSTLSSSKGPVYSLGALIHNPDVCSLFSKKGLKIISSPIGQEVGTVVIRAHGVGDEIRQSFIDAGFAICDATCPIVKRNIEMIRTLSSTHKIILVGDKDHDEMKAMSQVRNVPVIILEKAEDVSRLSYTEHYAVFVQTTFEIEPYQNICDVLVKKGYSVFFANAICPSSLKRRKAVLKLGRLCDAVIVVGGRNSANTNALVNLLQCQKKKVWHIENEGGVTEEMRSYEKIGLAAGASTSRAVIDKVYHALLGT